LSLHSDTEIYHAVVELAKFVARAVENMRRDMKPTMGKMLLEECVWMGVVVRRVNIAIDQAKLPLLEELLEQLEIVQFVLRLARDCRYVPAATFADSVPLTASVGRQATALRNYFAPAP
jgi:hypothetical protein